MKFWARASISALGLALAAAGYGSFGRYAFAQIPQVPGLVLEQNRLRVAHAPADSLYFAAPLGDLKAKRIDEGEAVFQSRDYAFAPGAVRYSPWRPGLELYFPLDFKFTLKTDLGPYLTWAEGSVGADVPGAPSRWYLLNFRDGQAPLMFVFEEPVQLIVTGDSANWTLTGLQKYKGWVRVLAPIGPKRVAANVASLGALAKDVGPLAGWLMRPRPNLVSFESRSDAGYLTAIWKFDGIGAQIPTPLHLCKAGGFETRILTGSTPILAQQAEGPVSFSLEPRIAVRFPMRRIPGGRALAVGKPSQGLSAASGFDVPSITELAISLLSGERDELSTELYASCSDEYRRALPNITDLVTGGHFATPGDGSGLDLLAGQALLQQCGGSGRRDLLDKAMECQDHWDWSLVAQDPKTRARATALFALAASFSSDVTVRARGAMAEASCRAASVMDDYAKRRDFPSLGLSPVQPMKPLRDQVFGDIALAKPGFGFIDMLTSPVRIVDGPAVTVERNGEAYILSWRHQRGSATTLDLATAYPVEIEALDNLAEITPSSFLAETRLHLVPKGEGVCRAILRLPPWALGIPDAVEPPRYSE
ncbi:MAG: hypothetical protein JNM28_03355 [Armatimonadetes bacterium]|nr:hypothetical protein [Armatimonadota bacterium]MBS1711212.1 hypothetical protein [Armatimonadota bacterium]MBX3108886.1 hypothetical protein [Fimbriimonadaceae bacterium]